MADEEAEQRAEKSSRTASQKTTAVRKMLRDRAHVRPLAPPHALLRPAAPCRALLHPPAHVLQQVVFTGVFTGVQNVLRHAVFRALSAVVCASAARRRAACCPGGLGRSAVCCPRVLHLCCCVSARLGCGTGQAKVLRLLSLAAA